MITQLRQIFAHRWHPASASRCPRRSRVLKSSTSRRSARSRSARRRRRESGADRRPEPDRSCLSGALEHQARSAEQYLLPARRARADDPRSRRERDARGRSPNHLERRDRSPGAPRSSSRWPRRCSACSTPIARACGSRASRSIRPIRRAGRRRVQGSLRRAAAGRSRNLNGARAYAQQVTARAQGDAAAFDKVYEQYRLAPEVTQRRMYYETMEKVLRQDRQDRRRGARGDALSAAARSRSAPAPRSEAGQ